MPSPGTALRKLGFLTIGLFDEHNPRQGHESTLDIIVLGEQLGFDSAWVRHRHLQYGISSPVAMLAAASQRTSRINLGTAVIPLAWENPLRLAEDLATVDVLTGGRLNPGVSVGPPIRWDDVKQGLYPDTAEIEDFSYTRVRRLLDLIKGEPVTSGPLTVGIEEFSDHVQPHSPGLIDRTWYGGGSERSARWAAENGLNLLVSNVVQATQIEDFAQLQLALVRAFRAESKARLSQGLVVIPTDTATPEQRAKYEAYVDKRSARVGAVHGPRRMMFARDIIGTSAQIAEQLYADPAFGEVDEVAFALPFTFEHEDYVQILTDIGTRLGPELGWRPAA
ncbi:LLM class flavin-dependent oxidoreductase [Kibdelosporangium phytohabitans]|uniref:Luciferase n=1 Tax=Kibdelosporangium phytohabitans TaxID=860235 RepID=A0A0N9HP37_9PSEU|nr:LLM class flavin-dependent oxidoreductase [Kibdelosporangium phytohabitans]ALG08760.1 luciferase [Kibdelosporangium phytohabitans]MBE1470117.1 alkanesulfonate monooxygenase SsuD/methylene tetrahydromethanopterin reductase-like flavin-dependent oxidoreductase (luciferase family) [Kibdelosporangium phytohabitans]